MSGPRTPRSRVPTLAAIGLGIAVGCGPRLIDPHAPRGPALPERMSLTLPQHPADPTGMAERALEASRYDEARRRLGEAKPSAQRDLLRAELALVTGGYDEAAEIAATVTESPESLVAVRVGAEALRRLGRLDEAVQRLVAVSGEEGAFRARLLLGEIEIERGNVAAAEAPLMSLVEAYNDRVIDDRRPFEIAMVGRAAYLLGSVHDANDAFNEAEEAGRADLRTLLWRADLFLDNYDVGHAAEVLTEAQKRAPHHPEVLAGLARVKLDENLDFEAAAKLADAALAVNPELAAAHGIHAGVALRDMDFDRAEVHLDRGLRKNPKNLHLLSLRATSRFLADDAAGLEGAKRAVLDLNPRYSRLYTTIADFADWEHRYGEIVEMMREALLADAGDAKVRSQLGLNLIRLGDDEGGVRALRRAFVDDPFNVRTFNTLELYEKIIPKSYVTEQYATFRVRYHRSERDILAHYVPDLLETAYRTFQKSYRFSPALPIGIELYPERKHFAVRTSGLPHTYIQGVCFGRTLAAMSPRDEHFNIGMTLWHELAHVFHIQLSKSHVPRWFTEGLAEYETLVARPEWKREHDAELYDALRTGRLPEVAHMNRAFSHARDMNDMTVAYYASSQIVGMMAEHYGRQRLRQMLVLWGEGKRTPEVIRAVLGKSPEQIDAEFRQYAEKKLAAYAKQFVPMGRPDDMDAARARVAAHPNDAQAEARLAKALLAEDHDDEASEALDRALALDPKNPDALYMAVRRAAGADDTGAAARHLAALLSAGHDGYAVQMMAAGLAKVAGDEAAHRRALEAAHAFDPEAAGPLVALAKVAEEAKDASAEIAVLEKLVLLEEHDGSIARALMKRLLDADRATEARDVGQSAVYADMESLDTHALYARALEASGDARGALAEYEVALACAGPPERHADVHERLAELSTRLGRSRQAAEHRRDAAKLRAGAAP